ncbi:MAG: TIGR04282 family arsenosugar biosynthesis glycosyltransferase [Pseudomarimonas sp.]
MTAALAIFVKTPGHSPIKTRLAAGIGESAALLWYAAAAAATASIAEQVSKSCALPVYWAVAEADALADSRWAGLPRLSQGVGGLGERMARVHAELVTRHGGGILIGADAPQLVASELLRAAHWLQSEAPRLVLGPANDGGFWLMGANRVLPQQDWMAIAYSQPHTAVEFRGRMQAHGAWLELAQLADVDHADDLVALVHALQSLAEPSTTQRQLLQLSRGLMPARVSA